MVSGQLGHFVSANFGIQFKLATTLLNCVEIFVPTDLTAPIMTIETRPTIRPYSIAVSPDSSHQNFLKSDI